MRAAHKPFVSADRAELMAIGKHKALGGGQLHSIGHQTRLQKRAGSVSISLRLASRIFRHVQFSIASIIARRQICGKSTAEIPQ
jgi:hypothetical protein